MPKTKIVCTVGPSSWSPEVLEQLIAAGLNVFRLNFSHGTHDEHRDVIRRIRELSQKANRPIAVLQDLCGPKIRVGKIAAGTVELKAGGRLTLTCREVPGDEHVVSVTYAGLPGDVAAGDEILLADGSIQLEVVETNDTDIRCKVVVGGALGSSKGINLPRRHLNVPSLTEKDKEDMAFGVKEGVDYMALSFVRTSSDVKEAKRMLKELRSEIPLIAKIEKHEALENIDEIIAAADGVMVARGDLGVETPLESVPRYQKRIIGKCNIAGKPVITATQMLLSMVDKPRPTRAEVTDVAHAILDGTDALMMSDETAVGKHPVKALETMVRIALDVEKDFPYEAWTRRFESEKENSLAEALAHAACHLAENINASCIVSFTQLGGTARVVSKYRPQCKILAPTPIEKTCRRLALVWGVLPVHIPTMETTDVMVARASELAQQFGLLKPGETVVVTAGVPVGVPGSTNTITAFTLGDPESAFGETVKSARRRGLFSRFRSS